MPKGVIYWVMAILLAFLLIPVLASAQSAPVVALSNITSNESGFYPTSTLLGWCNATDEDLDDITFDWKWFLDGEMYSQGIGSEPNHLWNLTSDWGGLDYGYGVAADNAGSIYVVGKTNSSGAGDGDIFLLKYDDNGDLLWNVTAGGELIENGFGLAIDSEGSIYAVGSTESFGSGGYDVWLLKYDSDGGLIWNKTAGGTDEDEGYSVAIDSSDNVYVAGSTLSFGSGDWDLWLLKYDTDGDLLWNVTAGGEDWDEGQGIAIDSSDNIYVVGYTEPFGSGEWDVWLLKYDTDGDLLWNVTAGGADWDEGYSVAIDSSDNIYVAGDTESFSSGGKDVWLLKYDDAGGLLWNITSGGANDDWGDGVAIDSSDNIYVAGYTGSFGVGDGDAWLLKYGTDGNLLWNTTLDKTDVDRGNGITIDSDDNIYAVGIAGYVFLENVGDILLLKYESLGLTYPSGTLANIANITSGLAEGQNWTLECTAYDGTDYSEALNSTNVTILAFSNSPPSIEQPEITSDPEGYYDTGILLGWCNATDADLDEITYSWNWYLDGELNSSGVTASDYTSGLLANVANITSGLVEGQNWKFECIAFDGTDYSESENSTEITIIAEEESALVFSSVWNTTNIVYGFTNSTTISLPLESDGTYDFTVDWGDGSITYVTSWDDSDANHTYAEEGIYTINITGTIVGFRFEDGGDKLKILNINSWGPLRVGNNGHYFHGCENLDSTATDNLNLTGTTNLTYMFAYAANFNGDVSGWNTSQVTDMSYMFYNAELFNQDIGGWNTSSVTNMSNMFSGAISFDQDLSDWNTSSVTDMSGMFSGVTLSTANYDSLLLGWSSRPQQNGVVFDAGNSMYSSAGLVGRDILTGTYGWIITDGGLYEESGNSAPVMRQSLITSVPTGYEPDSILKGWCNATDADLDNITYSWKWFLNGELNESGVEVLNHTQGLLVNVTTLNRTLVEGQDWRFECTAYDGIAYSEALNSTEITIVEEEEEEGGGGSSGGGGRTYTYWLKTYSTDEWEDGHTQLLSVRNRIRFRYKGQDYYVGIVELDASTALINFSGSDKQEYLGIGESANFEFPQDTEYLLNVRLNSIADGKANLTLSKIAMPTQETQTPPEYDEPEVELIINDELSPGEVGKDMQLVPDYSIGKVFNYTLLIIIILVISVLIVVVVVASYISKQPRIPPEIAYKLKTRANEDIAPSTSNKPVSELERIGGKSMGLPAGIMSEYETGANVPPELLAYTKDVLERGFSEEQIGAALLNAGWTRAQIDSAFRYLKR